MKLELISRYPKTPTSAVPLLFVHGSFAGAAVWDAHFLPYFAGQGFAAHALSLRGHGASHGRAALPWWGLRHYVADLKRVIATLEAPPVLIGHSMGGMVVQKYLESHPAPGAVLMASVPPHGLLASLCGMAVSKPWLLWRLGLVQCFGARLASLGTMRQALFSEATPDARLRAYYPLLQGESQRVCLDMLGLDPLMPRPKHDLPMLVLGAGKDAFFSTGLMRDLARHYRAELVILPDLAHALMLESGWRQAADRVLPWLHARFTRHGGHA